MWEFTDIKSFVVGATHKVSLGVLIAVCLFTPVSINTGTAQCVAILVSAAIFLIIDVSIAAPRVLVLRNIVVASAYSLILFGFLVFYGSGSPNFAANVGAWLSEHGLRLATSCLGAAIMEEILFRRYAQFHLQRILPINWALLLNAVLFMLLHGRLSVEIFCAGIAFGILASHFQCIYAAMLIHGLSNFIGMAGASMPRSDEVMPASLVLMGSWVSAFFAAFALLLLALVFTLVRARRSEL